MNQSGFESNDLFYDVPVVKNAKYYRSEARKKLSGIWSIAILVTLIASLLGGTMSGGISASFEATSSLDTGTAEEEEPTEEEVRLENERLQTALEHLRAGELEECFVTLSDDEMPMPRMVYRISLIAAIAGFITSIAVALFVSSPVKVGYQRFFLSAVDGKSESIRVGTLFSSFKRGYWNSVGANALYMLLGFAASIPSLIATYFGGTLLLDNLISTGIANLSLTRLLSCAVLPAVILLAGALITAVLQVLLCYTYGFTFLILADYPETGALQALRSSRALMSGNKRRLLCLDLSFIGWALLSAIACGLGFIVLTPYQSMAFAEFYHDKAQRQTAQQTEFPSLDPDDYPTDGTPADS